MSKNVLVILSSHPELAGEPNGTYMPELTHAIEALDHAGLSWDLVSVKGGAAPGYGADADETTKTMLADPAFAEQVAQTRPLSSVDPTRYDAVYYPGGYGLLFDLVDNAESGAIAASIYEKGGVIAAVCHGPAALSGIELSDGSRLIADRHVTGFTREEEVAMSTLDKVPFLVADRMLDAGAIYRKRSAWQSLVVTDGRLITGQNPGSAGGVGRAIAEALAD